MAEVERNTEMEDVRKDTIECKQKILGLNKELLPCKMLFFALDATMMSLFSFSTLFYVSSGLTPAKVGLSSGICSGLMMIAGPVWGGIIDMSKRKMLLLISLSLSTIFFEFCKPFVVYYVSKTTNICLGVNRSTGSNLSDVSLGRNCTRSVVQLLNPDELFIAITVNSILSSILMSGLMCYTEGVICKFVFTRQTKPAYGEQKVFAPIGAAVGSFLAGLAVDHYKPKHLSHYTAAFYVYVPFALMMIPLLCILTKNAKWDDGKKEDKGSLKKRLIGVLSNIDNAVFFISTFVVGVAGCLYGGYLFLFMRDTMNPSKTVMALTTVVAMASELVIYPFSSRIIRKCGGPIPCVIAGVFSYSLRLLFISFSTKAWHVFPIQLLHGIAMSLGWTAMIEYTYHAFPKEVTTTAIAFLFTVHMTGSSIISNIVGGELYTRYGGVVLFRGACILNTAWGIFMTFYFGIRHVVSKRNGTGSAIGNRGDDTRFSVENGNVHEIELNE